LKVSANVKIAMQCFKNFGGANAPNAPLVARLLYLPITIYFVRVKWLQWNLLSRVLVKRV